MDEDEFEDDDETVIFQEVGYAPMGWSWRTFAHNSITATATVCRVGASFLDTIACQFGCANEKWRRDKEKAEAVDEARRMLAALDEL